MLRAMDGAGIKRAPENPKSEIWNPQIPKFESFSRLLLLIPKEQQAGEVAKKPKTNIVLFFASNCIFGYEYEIKEF